MPWPSKPKYTLVSNLNSSACGICVVVASFMQGSHAMCSELRLQWGHVIDLRQVQLEAPQIRSIWALWKFCSLHMQKHFSIAKCFHNTYIQLCSPSCQRSAMAHSVRDQPQQRRGAQIWDVWKVKCVHGCRILMQTGTLSLQGRTFFLICLFFVLSFKSQSIIVNFI